MTDRTTDPPRDPVVGAVRDQADAIEAFGDAVGAVSRQIARVDYNLSAAIDGFADQHGKREAAEVEAAKSRVKAQQTLDAILHEVRRLTGRVTDVEGDVAQIKGERLAARANGNGSGEDPS